jgi:hypothetical protein
MAASKPIQMTITIEKLASIATAARDFFEKNKHTTPDAVLRNFPKGACGCVSELLGRYLEEQYQVSPLCVSAELNDLSTHAWLQINDVIIDLTADQFSQPPIIVSDSSAWHGNLKCEPPMPVCPQSGWHAYPHATWDAFSSDMKSRDFD